MRLNRVRIVSCAAGVLLACSVALGATARDNSFVSPGNQLQLSNIRIDNFGRINQNYYRGAQPEGRDYADLATLGVRTVIDLTKDGVSSEEAMVQRAGMHFYRIELTTHEVPSPEAITQFLKLVNDPANQPIYVHCQGGRHRTGVMTAVFRMTNDHWTADQAFAEMKKYKFGADFLHTEFKDFVFAYPAELAHAAAPGALAAARVGA